MAQQQTTLRLKELFINVMEKEIQRLADISLDPGKYYILLSAGTGDTLVYLGLRRYMEREWGGPIRYLIRRSHEVIMKMYGVEEYDVLDFEAEGFSYMSCDELRELSDQCPYLRKGGIWVAFMGNHRELVRPRFVNLQGMKMRDFFEYTCKLPATCWESFERPKSDSISVSDTFLTRLTAIADVSRMVLLVPEAGDKALMTRKIDAYWEEQIKMYNEQGLTVVVNALQPFPLAGATHVSMTLEEALWLGLHCHSILALRSGICDLLAFFRAKDMTVIYKNHVDYLKFNFYDLFRLQVKEKIVLPQNSQEDLQQITKYYLVGGIKILTIIKIFPDETRYYFCGIPIVRTYIRCGTKRVRVLGITLWKISRR